MHFNHLCYLASLLVILFLSTVSTMSQNNFLQNVVENVADDMICVLHITFAHAPSMILLLLHVLAWALGFDLFWRYDR